MDFKKKKLEGYKVQYDISLNKEEMAEFHNSAIKSMGKSAKIPGFRKGHIPMEVLEKSLNPAQVSTTEIDLAVDSSIRKVIDADDIYLLDQPSVEIIKYVPGDTLEIKVIFEMIPPVSLADPAKLKVKKETVNVKDSQIDEVIDRLAASAATRELVDRKAKKGDEVIIDFTGIHNGEEFAGGQAKDYSLVLGSGSFIPGFEDGIVGHKSGEDFDIDVTFPEDYGAKNLAGKKATFKISLKKINELKKPELNDDFAKTIAPDLKTMDALRADIKAELAKQAESSARQKYTDALVQKLVEKSKLDIPSSLIDAQVQQTKKEFETDLMYRGMSFDDYLEQIGKTAEQWEAEDARESAANKIGGTLVLRQIIRDYDLSVSDEEIDEECDRIMSMYNNPEIRKNFENASARTEIKQNMLTRKALDKLVELNEK